MLDSNINPDEYLYRGVVEVNWDFNNNRPSSATFKDSTGVSVDRDGGRIESECLSFLSGNRDFYAICKVQTATVRNLGAEVIYSPLNNNIYHSEIHDSLSRIQMRGSKPRNIRESSTVVFKKP